MNSFSGDDQFIVPDVSGRMNLREVFSGVVWQEPDFAELLIGHPRSGRKIIRAPIENRFGRLTFSGNPHVDVAIDKFIADTRSELEMNLKGHPFVCDISETVSFGWKIALTGCLRIKTVR